MGRSYYGEGFDIELAAAGKPQAWRVGEGKNQRLWELVTLALPPAELRAFAGDYRSEELDVTFNVEPKGSGLSVVHSFDVAPLEKDAFVGDWVGIMKFTRDARGAVSGFTVNRETARGVRFDRVR